MSDQHPDHDRRWLILGILCGSLIVIVVAVSSLNVAIPTLQNDLDPTASQLQWIIDSYALIFAGLLLSAGALGDRFGRKGALQLGLLIFGGSAVLSSLATDPVQLIVTRGIMGIGAALIMPATLSIITTVFPPEERQKAIATWAGFAGVGGAIGPITSGVLLEHFSWSSIFFVNVPLVALALVLNQIYVPTSRDDEGLPLDPVGSLVSTVTLGALLFGIIEGPGKGWTSGMVLGSFVLAAVGLALFLAWELRIEHPMLDPRFFKRRGFSMGSVTITLAFFAMFGMFFALTLYLQFVKGYSPLGAGVRTLPFAATLVVVSPRSASLSARYGPRPVVTAGLVILGVGLALMALFDESTSYPQMAATFVPVAAGIALAMAPSTAAIVTSLPLNKAGVGSAMNDTTREVGGAIGIAVIGTMFTTGYRHALGDGLDGLPASAREAARDSIGGALGVAGEIGGSTGRELAALARESFSTGFAWATLSGAVVVLGAALLMWRRFPESIDAPHAPLAEAAAIPPGEGPGSIAVADSLPS